MSHLLIGNFRFQDNYHGKTSLIGKQAMISQAVGGQEAGLEVIGQVERLKWGGRFLRREFGSCWRDGACVEGGVWRRAQVEGFLSGWDGYLSGWEGYLSTWDGYLSDLSGATAEAGGLGAEEIGEVFGDEGGDVGEGVLGRGGDGG